MTFSLHKVRAGMRGNCHSICLASSQCVEADSKQADCSDSSGALFEENDHKDLVIRMVACWNRQSVGRSSAILSTRDFAIWAVSL